MPILLLLTFLVIFAIHFLLNNRRVDYISIIILIYIGMAFFSVIYSSTNPPGLGSYSILAMLYLGLCLSITFLPLLTIKEYHHKPIVIENMRFFGLIRSWLVISSYIAICFFLPLSALILRKLDISQARYSNTIILQEYINLFGRVGSILNTYFSLISNMFPITLAFSFIQLSVNKGPRKYWSFLASLLSTLCYVVYILAYVGRDGIVFWILTFVIEYNIFKEYLDKAQLKKSLRLPLLCIVFCMAILFVYITKGRFGETLDEIVDAIVSYMGQQVSNFSDRYSINAPISYGRTNFPLFINIAEAIGIRVPYIAAETITAYYSSRGLYSYVFATFVGSFLSDFGKLGTISILLFISIYMTWIINVRARKVWYLSDLLLLLLYCQTISWGVFYFRLYSANSYLIVLMTILLILRVLRRSQKGRKEFIYPIQS